MRGPAPRRLLLLVVPPVLLAALVFAFVYAPAPAAQNPSSRVRRADTGPPPARRPPHPSVTGSPRTVTFTLRVAADSVGSPDLDQSGVSHRDSPSGAGIARATAAARAFLATYLRYSYGQAPARLIPDATAALVRTLARHSATVLSGEHALHPRLLTLGVSGGRAGEVALLASVSDGRLTYAVEVTVTRAPRGRWLVSAVW